MIDDTGIEIDDDSGELPSSLYSVIGEHFGRTEAVREARVAYEMGEIDLWFDLNQSRTREDWDAWQAEHGTIRELHERWAEKSSTEE